MAINRKGSRRITVKNEIYLWRVRDNWDNISIVIQHQNASHQFIISNVESGVMLNGKTPPITPSIIRRAIESALKNDWKPLAETGEPFVANLELPKEWTFVDFWNKFDTQNKMKNNLQFKNSKPLNKENLMELEQFTGFTLPENIKTFLSENAGARVYADNTDCIFDVVYPDDWKTGDGLLFVESFNSIKEKWQYRSYLKDFIEDFEVSEDYVEVDKLFPLLECHSGSAIYIAIGGQHDEKIYHVDNGDFGFCLLAKSLDIFFDKCYPEEEV